MKRKRFTEEQIIGILKEHEAGASTASLARRGTPRLYTEGLRPFHKATAKSEPPRHQGCRQPRPDSY